MEKVQLSADTVRRIVEHWIETSDDDFRTMLVLYESKSYHWTLFMGHISMEKLLKALYVNKLHEHAPFTHNLYRLAELTGLEFPPEYSDWLVTITAFNLNARYDDYKKGFYALCTKEYTDEWSEKIKTLRTWIKQML